MLETSSECRRLRPQGPSRRLSHQRQHSRLEQWRLSLSSCPRSTALYEERKRIRAELDAAPPPTEVIALHPAVLARYEEQLTSLQEALDRGARAGDSECAEAIRDLVEPLLSSVTHPDQVESKLKSSAVSLHSWARRPIQIASEECGERW